MIPTLQRASPRRLAVPILALALAFAALALPGLAWSKPKAVVITGKSNDADDKARDDKAAAEAKKDLEAAGYEVEVMDQPTKAAVVDKIKDTSTAAVWIIAHGAKGSEDMDMKKADGTADPLLGADLAGTFDHIKIATIHSCDQNQQSWKDKFPKSDFKSWDGCVLPSTIQAWQDQKKYELAEAPKEKQETHNTHPLIEDGQFFQQPSNTWAPNTGLSGNWPMNPVLTAAFGSQAYNFFIYEDGLSNPNVLFSAVAANGVVQQYELDQAMANPSFDIFFTYELYINAIENPFLLLDPSVLGTQAFVVPAMGNSTDASTLFAGVAKNIFNMDPTLPNGGHPLPLPATLMLALLGLGLMARRAGSA